jgi:hypothetical protein
MVRLICFCLLGFAPTLVMGAQDPRQNCFRLAALPADPQNEFEAVPYGALDASAIIASCSPFLLDDEDGKVHFHLGRGYLRKAIERAPH